MKGFIYNGQLDAESTSVPSLQNLANTYRGDVSETCLNDKAKLLDTYFEEMYLTGTIMEDTFLIKMMYCWIKIQMIMLS